MVGSFVVWSLTLNFVRIAGVPKSKAQFSGAGGWRTYVNLMASPFPHAFAVPVNHSGAPNV
jgi:hypothetical protein